MEKNAHRAVRIVKKLGRGGPMKYFLKFVHPFTRSVRILVAVWRWIEAAQCRRGEVGTEEAMVCTVLLQIEVSASFLPSRSFDPIGFCFLSVDIIRRLSSETEFPVCWLDPL